MFAHPGAILARRLILSNQDDHGSQALERSGQLLGRVNPTFFNITGTFTNDALHAVEKEMSPKLAAQSDAILLSRGGSAAAMTLFRDFRGAEPDIEPLLKRRGLEQPQPR